MLYLISTLKGWFYSSDERLAEGGYTIHSLIDELKNDLDQPLMFVSQKPATGSHKFKNLWVTGQDYITQPE